MTAHGRTRQKIGKNTVVANLGSGAQRGQPTDLRSLARALRPHLDGLSNPAQTGGASGAQPFTPHGFGFFIGGLMLANELLGGVVFQKNMIFGTDSPYLINSEIPATADAVFNILTAPGVQAGTITFSAGTTTGVLAWASPPFSLSAGTQLRVRAPDPADATLSYISGNITGAIGS